MLYYGITNLATLRLPPEKWLFPVWILGAGLAGCLGLAFWVEPTVWLTGLALLAGGLTARFLLRRARDFLKIPRPNQTFRFARSEPHAAPPQCSRLRRQRFLVQRVEAGERLIEQGHARPVQHGAAELDLC